MPLMTKKDYARHRGCSAAYVSKKDVAARLAPAMVMEKGQWLVDSEKADALLSASRDPATDLRAASEGPSATGEYTVARTKAQYVRLEMESLELSTLKGQTLPRGKTYQAAQTVGQNFREALQGRNRRLAEQLVTMTDAREIMILLEQEDRQLLESISSDFLRRLQTAERDSGQKSGD